MTITFPRELPDVGYVTADFLLRDSVKASPSGARLINYTQIEDPVWEASLTTRPLVYSDYAVVEAWWLSLREGLRTVLFRHPHVCYPAAHGQNQAPADDAGALVSVTDGNVLAVNGVDAGLVLTVGDRLGLERAGRYYVGRVTEVSGTGTTRTITVEPPPFDTVAQAGAVVRFAKPALAHALCAGKLSGAPLWPVLYGFVSVEGKSVMALSDEVKDLYDEGRISTRQMVRVQLGSGIFGFIARREPLVFAGVTYQPFGLLEVSDIGGGTGTAADGGFTLTLAESPSDGLTPEILTEIETEDYRDQPVVVFDAHFHPDTGALLQVEPVARGYLDVIEHNADDERGYFLTARCEGRQLDYSRKNGRTRTVADQKRRDPGDRFFEHASMAGRVDVNWGRSVGSAVNTAKSAAAGAARAIGFKGL